VVIPDSHGQRVEPFKFGRPDRITPRRSAGDPGFDGSHVIRKQGVSSAFRRCMSSAAVVAAAAADLAADRSDRRAYQTAPIAPRTDTIDTTKAAIPMISLAISPRVPDARHAGTSD
jgi:hypothetical protein